MAAQTKPEPGCAWSPREERRAGFEAPPLVHMKEVFGDSLCGHGNAKAQPCSRQKAPGGLDFTRELWARLSRHRSGPAAGRNAPGHGLNKGIRKTLSQSCLVSETRGLRGDGNYQVQKEGQRTHKVCVHATSIPTLQVLTLAFSFD
ncbi:hypothetical protein AAFF_G00420710 [Aldrovandia affinis]|uniref:Uncharacterized protein n=1 Tax=Aldrovandia affinis TaxID=143900 RepID=A0AAD7S9X1_9TELE|nr:hypothetical protein AAFF_G00420710 [Aldrovandia affinis]